MTIIRKQTGAILSALVEYNGVVYLAGVTADDNTASVKAQTENILSKIDERLAMAGTDKTKLLTATVYVSDISLKAEMNAAWTAWLDPASVPTRACVAVGLDGGADVEIVVSAAK